MQDNRRQLKDDGRGVAGLPLKLIVTMTVLCIMIPVVVNAMESTERTTVGNDLDREADRIRDAVAVVYYSGSDSSRALEFNLPTDCYMVVGGEDENAYSIRTYVDDELFSTKYFEKPVIGFDEIVIEGNCILKISCVGNNEMEMMLI